jgi:hypothetical protein
VVVASVVVEVVVAVVVAFAAVTYNIDIAVS